jgi:hypothetical protein
MGYLVISEIRNVLPEPLSLLHKVCRNKQFLLLRIFREIVDEIMVRIE